MAEARFDALVEAFRRGWWGRRRRGALLEALVAAVRAGDTPAVADALAGVEDERPRAFDAQRALLERLVAATPRSHTVVGMTGPPGAGKSTLAGRLIRRWLDDGASVAMTAVDPSSRRSGGALLGDRARLRFDPGERVFVRSMAARERLGGLAPATRAAVVVMRAAFPWTLVETVGVGQSEVDVASVADSVALVLQPDSGDTLQFMKAGILEIPDVLVVNKSDLGAPAERTRGDLEAMLSTAGAPDGWRPPVIPVSARTGDGIDALADSLAEHRAHLEAGALEARRESGALAWTLELFRERYGTLGIERLGGAAAAEALARATPGTPLDRFRSLARRTRLGAP